MKKIFLSLVLFLALFFGCGNVMAAVSKISTDYLFNFAAYGDSRTGYEVHQQVAGQLYNLNPDFVLHTGDFVNTASSIDEWNRFNEITESLRGRSVKPGLARNFFPTMGNHDVSDLYYDYLSVDPYYSFNYKNWHFISVNVEVNYAVGSEQYNWLASDLESNKQKEIIIFLHYPAYSSGPHGGDVNTQNIQDILVPLFEQYNVRMVFSGHDHIYERTYAIKSNEVNSNGIVYVVAGSGGAPLYDIASGNWWTAKVLKSYNYVFLQATNRGIFGKAFDNNGVEIDSFEIIKHNAEKRIAAVPVSKSKSNVKIFKTDGHEESNFLAFSKKNKKGARIASGDVDLDGKSEIIIGAGSGGKPLIKIFDLDGTLLDSFYAFSKKYKGGIDVSAGDVDGDGRDEIAVSRISGKKAYTKVFYYNSAKTVYFSKNVFPKLSCGATVALGDVDLDGKKELIVGTTKGVKSKVKIYDVLTNNKSGELLPIYFSPFSDSFKNGIDVALGDVDGDNYDEIGVSKFSDSKADVMVYKYNESKTLLGSFRAFSKKYDNGANLEMFDVDFDGKAELITTQNSGKTNNSLIKFFNYKGKRVLKGFYGYKKSFTGGVAVAGINE